MFETVYDFKSFYNTRLGRMTRRILQNRIREIWPNIKGLSLMGVGYAVPYLRVFDDEASNIFAIMTASKGAHHWPHDGLNTVAMAHSAALPIETNSLDRVLMMHDLEFCEYPHAALAEIWRTLKSNGRLMVVVPNRTGLWARGDHSPFGQGAPYSLSQLSHNLRQNKFVIERSEEALFMPPISNTLILRGAGLFEQWGRKIMPFGAGVHIIEASKQLYAPVDKGRGSAVAVSGQGRLMPKPVARI